MENTPNPGEDQGGLDRRTVLRRGAILGGALVWTVPAVQTLAGPAFAAGTGCTASVEVKTIVRGVPIACSIITFKQSDDCCDCITEVSATLGAAAAAVLCSIGGTCEIDNVSPCTV